MPELIMRNLKAMTFIWIMGLCLLLQKVESARILCVSHQYGSHLLMAHALTEDLLAQGHEVYTIFSDRMPVPKGLDKKGFKVLQYHTPEDGQIMANPENEAKLMEGVMNGKVQSPGDVSRIAYSECSDIDGDKNLEKQLFELKFDLVVVNIFPPCTCLMFVPMKLKLPFVLMHASLDMEITRIPLLPSFHPMVLFEYSDNMTFRQRFINTVASFAASIPALSPFPALGDVRLIQKYCDDPSVTTWNILARKAALHFVARGGMLDYPVPLSPNVINVECLTCKLGKPLPDDIQKLADSSEGMIVVSFGSLITRFPDETAKKFLSAFSQRNELIFWRYKAKLPGTVPPNVKIMKWLPQNDLLAHPKTKLFITHSGNNGQYESVYHGVPMLAFPLFAEQHHNAHRITVHGYGLASNIVTFTVEELVQKIDQIISVPSFHEKTQHASKIFKSMPMNAQETATYWINHVLEFGSEHLKGHALDMPWYAFYMFDIMALLHILFVMIFLAMILVSCYIKRKCSPALNSKVKKH